MNVATRRIGSDWLLDVVEDDGEFVNVVFKNTSNSREEVGIMFWTDGGDTITFAFCSDNTDQSGILAMDFTDIQLFTLFANRIKTAKNAIEYGKSFGAYHKKGDT